MSLIEILGMINFELWELKAKGKKKSQLLYCALLQLTNPRSSDTTDPCRKHWQGS